MTDYTAIQESQTDPEAPITSALMKALAKNWIAGFEGNAPFKISGGAIPDGTIGYNHLGYDVRSLAQNINDGGNIGTLGSFLLYHVGPINHGQYFTGGANFGNGALGMYYGDKDYHYNWGPSGVWRSLYSANVPAGQTWVTIGLFVRAA